MRVPLKGVDGEHLGVLHPAQARKMLRNKKAYVCKKNPFTIKLIQQNIKEEGINV